MKFCVIGLGRFGYQIATVLADNGMEVLALDSNETVVSKIRDSVTQAICLRVIDETSLKSLGVDEVDTVIVTMGESFAQSILVTALVKKLGVPKIIARAVNDIHKDILKLVGATRIILPEKEMGTRIADMLSSPFTDLIRLTKDFAISQIIAPKQFIGQKIQDLDLFKNYTVYCIGIKKSDDKAILISPDHIIQEKDRLIFVGDNKHLEKIIKL
jgi:trk system potassium uptake protein